MARVRGGTRRGYLTGRRTRPTNAVTLEAAEAQVVRILGSLALYYLPRPNDVRKAITQR